MGRQLISKPQVVQEKEESDLDKVLKALTVAKTLTGTVADVSSIYSEKARREAEAQLKQNELAVKQAEEERKKSREPVEIEKLKSETWKNLHPELGGMAVKNEYYKVLTNKTKGEMGAAKELKEQEVEEKAVPPENRAAITDLAKKNAEKMSISNQLEAVSKTFADPGISKDQKIVAGQQLLKTLNSTEGKDAVGNQEADRLGSLLKFQVFNFTQPGPVFGRADLSEFKEQVDNSAAAIRRGIGANEAVIQQLKGGSKTMLGAQPEKTAPTKKGLAEMSTEDIKKELARKTGLRSGIK